MFILNQYFFPTQPYICIVVLNLSKIFAFEMHLIVLHTAFWLTELIPARIKHRYGNMKEILSLLYYQQDKDFAERTLSLCLNSSSHKPWHVMGGPGLLRNDAAGEVSTAGMAVQGEIQHFAASLLLFSLGSA